ncbi:MAG: hypothetical protein JKY60_10080 [Kordiimonadaceae bacterium]|nr:hypothetical protein [Kordiimonadaceae bacterium]
MKIQPYDLIIEDWHEEDVGLYENRGWCNAQIVFEGKTLNVEFYDPLRLAQDISTEIESLGCFILDHKLVVVSKVTLEEMEKAAGKLIAYM